MAACGSLEHIFEKPLPENPTLLESLSSWKQMKSMKPIDDSSFTEIFGELHFKENHHDHVSLESSPSSSSLLQSSPASSLSPNSKFFTGIENPKTDRYGSSSIYQDKDIFTSTYYPSIPKKHYKLSDKFSSMNPESLSLCTEGLGSESFDDVDDLLSNDIICNNDWQHQEERQSFTRNIITPTDQNHLSELKRARTNRETFPPPISCIGRSGKPWICFKSYRQDGRFILKEIRIPTQEFLHACRQNGRLKLQFIQSDDETLEEDEENIEENNEDTDNNSDDGDYIAELGRIVGEEEENGEDEVETGNSNVHGSSLQGLLENSQFSFSFYFFSMLEIVRIINNFIAK